MSVPASHPKRAPKGALFATLVSTKELQMHLTSPFFIVPVIVVIFVVAILFATSTKEDGHSTH